MTTDERILTVLTAHIERYPALQIADVYKLLHQAVFGPGHAIANKRKAREWLEHERTLVLPDRLLPLVESIHPEHTFVRLHLRPYLAYRESIVPLLDAFVRSARNVTGDPAQMAAWWQVFRAQLEPGAPWAERFDAREAHFFGQTRASEQWPAVHHAPVYNEMYKPVYRVLTVNEAEGLCDKLKAPFEIV